MIKLFFKKPFYCHYLWYYITLLVKNSYKVMTSLLGGKIIKIYNQGLTQVMSVIKELTNEIKGLNSQVEKLSKENKSLSSHVKSLEGQVKKNSNTNSKSPS